VRSEFKAKREGDRATEEGLGKKRKGGLSQKGQKCLVKLGTNLQKMNECEGRAKKGGGCGGGKRQKHRGVVGVPPTQQER